MHVFHGFSQCLDCLWFKQISVVEMTQYKQSFLWCVFLSFFFFNDTSHSFTAQIEFHFFLDGKDSGISQRRHSRNKSVHTKNMDN